MLAYNDLPAVEDASDALSRRAEFPDFLEAFAFLAHAAAMPDVVGAFLLHRHFLVARDEDVCERFDLIGGSQALVSAPVQRSAGQRPHRWAFAAGEWLPLEYSDDPAVARHQADLAEFRAAFGDLLDGFALTALVGLALVARDRLQPRSGEVCFEETTADASVVTCVPDVAVLGTFINTLWVPDVADPQMRCHQWQRCRREGSPPDDRHSYLSGHDREL